MPQPNTPYRAFRSLPRWPRQRLAPRLGAAALLLALLAAAPARAADPVFPPGARIGIAPPGQMMPSRSFSGFEDRALGSVILTIELPAAAYAELEKSMTIDMLAKQGLVVEKREPFVIGNGKAVLMSGRQESGGNRFRKWILLAAASDLTAIVTVQIPEGAAKSYPDAAVKSALATLSVRITPVSEQMELLSFRLDELAGFRIARVTPPNALLLIDGPQDDVDNSKQSHLVVAVGPGGPEQAGDRGEFARQAMSAVPGFKEMRITSAEPMRLGGQQAYEVRADAKNAKTDTPVTIVQWLRFGSGGFVRMVGVAPKDVWSEAFPRFRAIRDGVTPR